VKREAFAVFVRTLAIGSVAIWLISLVLPGLIAAAEDGTSRPSTVAPTWAWTPWGGNDARPAVEATCDGPHRVYVVASGYLGNPAIALVVVPNGCVDVENPARPSPPAPCRNRVGAVIPCPEARP
jgi:hypothetical protein